MADHQGWPNELRNATKRLIVTRDVLPLNGGVPFKNIEGSFEITPPDDLAIVARKARKLAVTRSNTLAEIPTLEVEASQQQWLHWFLVGDRTCYLSTRPKISVTNEPK